MPDTLQVQKLEPARRTETQVDAVILGATGYVGGELLRLLHFHPELRLAAAVSRSQAGTPLGQVFPHLARDTGSQLLASPDALAPLLETPGPLAVFSALPHGASATDVAQLLERARVHGKRVLLVDLSADFRLRDADVYAATYGKPHGAPHLLAQFTCALPEHCDRSDLGFVSHPGCFTTLATLACRPFVGRVEPLFAVSAVTGSTGAGREPTATTHHPFRHANMRAYSVLRHRHEIEMRALVAAGSGAADAAAQAVEITFVPHSGPFARGIHATIFARLLQPSTSEDARALLRQAYAGAPFVTVVDEPPALKDVTGTNRCLLYAEARGHDLVVLGVLDNLTKGAAGGGIQWMNRLLGWDETTGLDLPALGWS